MIKMVKVLGVIPARGGSKGIPRKNIVDLNGKPLIYYTIKAAQDSKLLTKFVVSTDDAEIKEVSESFGAEVIDRPAELAKDSSGSYGVLMHALESVEGEYDAVIMLQPTSPLRISEDIDNAIKLFSKNRCDLVLGVTELEHLAYPILVFKKGEEGVLEHYEKSENPYVPRQDLEKLYRINGAIYVISVGCLNQQKTIFGKDKIAYVMPQERSVDIDNNLDIKIVKALLN